MIDKEVELTTGKKLTIKALNIRQRTKISTYVLNAFNSGDQNLEAFLDAALFATGLSETKLSEAYTDNEIYEIGGHVFAQMNMSDEEKKN